MLTKQAETDKNLLRALAAIGGGAAGYLGSRYLLDVKDAPLNLLAGGLGAGTGLVGSQFLIDGAEKENEEIIRTDANRDAIASKGAGSKDFLSRRAYELAPRLDTGTGAGVASGLIAAERLSNRNSVMASQIKELNRMEAAHKASKLPTPFIAPLEYKAAVDAKAFATNSPIRNWTKRGKGSTAIKAAGVGIAIKMLVGWFENLIADGKQK